LALNHDYILVYAKDAAEEMHSLKWRTAQSEEYLKRYKELDPDGKRLWNCIISRGKTKEIFNSDNKSMFDELLDSISNTFEYWRYIYEKDDGFIDINFLRFFRLLLREICCEQLYDKTWKEYIE